MTQADDVSQIRSKIFMRGDRVRLAVPSRIYPNDIGTVTTIYEYASVSTLFGLAVEWDSLPGFQHLMPFAMVTKI